MRFDPCYDSIIFVGALFVVLLKSQGRPQVDAGIGSVVFVLS